MPDFLDPSFEDEDTLIVTEFDAGTDDADWIEIKNIGDKTFSSLELLVAQGDDVIFRGSDFSEVPIPPGAYLGLSAHLTSSENQIQLPNLKLANHTGSIVIGHATEEKTLDSVSYDTSRFWPIYDGSSTRLDPTQNDNDDPFHWCSHGLNQPQSIASTNPPCLFQQANDDLVDNEFVYSDLSEEPISIRIELNPAELSMLNQVVDKSEPGVGPFVTTVLLDDGQSHQSTIEVRGGSSRLSPQKSFKIRLPEPVFQNQSVLNLNKSPFDFSRIRNHVAFNLMRSVPHNISLRTQLVHLTVNDEDYGLFTHVEQVNERSLRQHGLDSRGHLWKPVDFSFFNTNNIDSEESIKQSFGNNAAELRDVVAKLNDETIPLDTIVDTHFNRSNLFHWLAMYYLFDNRDSTSQNYYLYSPPNASERFYLLPWDFDGAFDWNNQHGLLASSSSKTVGNWWKVPLFKRLIASESFLVEFQAALSSVYTSLNSGDVGQHVDELYSKASPVIFSSPADANSFAIQGHDHAQDILAIKNTLSDRFVLFQTQLETPMPFWGSAATSNNRLEISWSPAPFDLQNDPLTMRVLFSTGDCENNIETCFDNSNIVKTLSFAAERGDATRTFNQLALPGRSYFIRFVVFDDKGNSQIEFDELLPNQIVIP